MEGEREGVFQAEEKASAKALKEDLAHSVKEEQPCQVSCSRKLGTSTITE